MDSVWVRADRRYSLKPVDKLLALIHKHRIKHTDFIGISLLLCVCVCVCFIFIVIVIVIYSTSN